MSTKLNKLCPQSLPRIDNKANNDGYVTKRAKMSLKHFQSFPNSIRDYPHVTSGQSYKQFTIVNYSSRVVIWANL